MGLTALCPGTFDPVTNGHLDVVGRAAQLFDAVIVGVVENPSKTPLFSVDERVRLLEEALKDLTNVRVGSFRGLLVDHARAEGASVIVKGLRAISDYEYEIQMAQMNQRIGGVETLFMATSPKWSFLSSSLVKEVARLGGDVEGLVPERLLEQRHPLLDGEQRCLGGVLQDRDHDAVEHARGASDDVQMPVGHRVERSRTQGGQAHRSSRYWMRRLSP